MKRTGIMGGTFDPIHNGHINIAKAAMREYHLDRVIFLTSGNPPHKRERKILDASLRHIMVKRAVSDIEGFEPCDWETRREEYSYTVNTLMHFKEIFPDEEFFFIIGGDSLKNFDKWYMPDKIKQLCTVLAYDRGSDDAVSDFALRIHSEKIDISSTQIRDMVKNGEDISGSVPETVKNFIERNGLYKQAENFEEKLKTMLTPERYAHSLGVRDTAVMLAGIYGADKEKARIAGLLHDNAKNMADMMQRCADLEVDIDDAEKKNPALIHAKLGAETAKCEFGICDREITDAIKWHTVGRENMSLLEKIVFVADLTEPGRDFPDADRLRSLSITDIDRAVYECVLSTVEVNKKRGAYIHPNAFKIIEEYRNSQK